MEDHFSTLESTKLPTVIRMEDTPSSAQVPEVNGEQRRSSGRKKTKKEKGPSVSAKSASGQDTCTQAGLRSTAAAQIPVGSSSSGAPALTHSSSSKGPPMFREQEETSTAVSSGSFGTKNTVSSGSLGTGKPPPNEAGKVDGYDVYYDDSTELTFSSRMVAALAWPQDARVKQAEEPLHVDSPRSARSAGSNASRRSGMTQAEVDEMREMALENSKKALREALQRLRTTWDKEASSMPSAEATRLRQRLSRGKDLKGTLKAARAPSAQSVGRLELGLLWERCRVRGSIARAIQLADYEALKKALDDADSLGLSVELEHDLCDELRDQEQRRLEPISRQTSARSRTADGALPEAEEGASVQERSTWEAGASQHRWWHRLQWWGPAGRAGRKPSSSEMDLQLAVQQHVHLGGMSVPHDLAIDLGLVEPNAGPPPPQAALAAGLSAARQGQRPLRQRKKSQPQQHQQQQQQQQQQRRAASLPSRSIARQGVVDSGARIGCLESPLSRANNQV